MKFLLVFVLAFYSSEPLAGREEYPAYEKVSLGGSFGENRFKVNLECAPMKRIETLGEASWGRSGSSDQNAIKVFNVSFQDKKISIPESAYKNLLNITLPRGLVVLRIRDQLVVQLSGGDGGGSYVSRFYMHGNRLVRREIFKGGGDLSGRQPADTKVY